jgi:hypothetical protein
MKLLLALISVGASLAQAQQRIQLTPREIFYHPATTPQTPDPKPGPKGKAGGSRQKSPVKTLPDGTQVLTVAANAVPLGLKCLILREKGDALEEASLNETFRTGDHIRIRVEANRPAYLYIVQQGASGKWELLFPVSGSTRTNPVPAYQPVTVPDESHQITFREPAGTENLFVMLSLDRIPEFENSDVKDDLINGLRASSRDLVIEPVTPRSRHDSSDKNETAMYWINNSQTDPGRMVTNLQLKHQ